VLLRALDDDDACEAIVAPFNQRRIVVEPDLVSALLHDLRRAAAALASPGESVLDGCYPPHLRRVCARLYDALNDDEAVVTRAHYQRIGGEAAILSAGPAEVVRRYRFGRVMAVAACAATAITVAVVFLRGQTSPATSPAATQDGSSS
jgi:hypothetical protein